MITEQLRTLIEKASISPDLSEYLNREESGDAELFKFRFEGRAAFDHSEKCWYLWNDRYWKEDQIGEVIGFISNELAADYLGAAEEEQRNGNKGLSNQFIKRSKQLMNLNRIINVLELASHLPGIALEGKEWDTPPMLLPVLNGTINLTDGNIRNNAPIDYFRANTPTEWLGLECPAPRWEEALWQIFRGDNQKIEFMQRLWGYCLTGDTREQVLPILWGIGANGKSTLVDALSFTLGRDFCFTTQADSLMDSSKSDGNAARPFVYALRNKRLVWASESKEGRRLDAGLVKQLTGDSEITARKLYGQPVTFKQTHKIILITNHCPRIPDGDDYALWRRVIRIPFEERFVDNPEGPHEHPRNMKLVEHLKAEKSGILAWLVRGCLDWQSQGLNPPQSVLESTQRYRDDEDLMSQFINSCLSVGEGHEVTASLVYKEYVNWCSDSGNHPMSARALGQRLTFRFGETSPKWTGSKTERFYHGVGLSIQ